MKTSEEDSRCLIKQKQTGEQRIEGETEGGREQWKRVVEQWNSGTVEQWNSGQSQPAIFSFLPILFLFPSILCARDLVSFPNPNFVRLCLSCSSPRSDVPLDDTERERESDRDRDRSGSTWCLVWWLVLGVECARTSRMKNKREEGFENWSGALSISSFMQQQIRT